MNLSVSRLFAVLFVVLLVAVAPAAADERVGGAVVVAAGETVDGTLDAVGGTVVVYGTVDGDVNAVGGTVQIAPSGVVTGDLLGSGGAVTIEGRVDGDVDVGAGAFALRESGVVGGALDVGAGDVVIDGAVAGDVRIGADRVRIGPTAAVGGSVTYDSDDFAYAGSGVAGTVSRADLGYGGSVVGFDGGPGGLFAVPSWVGVAYRTLAHLALGALFVLVAPKFAADVRDAGLTDAARSGGIGLLALVGVPLALVLVAVTVIGIPLALLGGAAYALLLWAGLVLGAYTFGAWALRAADADSDSAWRALAVGLLVVALTQFVPGGGLLRLALTLVGVGAVVTVVRARYDGRDGDTGTGPAGRPSTPETDDVAA
ncbi:bactofilin family protein [Halobaculum sp. P14]|uniref:bactofilin family protein n=1 Tax=Halobaculum sp. P14 TaxID=3421638 RepID=UPI003EBB74F7